MYVKYVYTYHCIAFWFQIQTLLKMEMGPLNIPLLSISTDKSFVSRRCQNNGGRCVFLPSPCFLDNVLYQMQLPHCKASAVQVSCPGPSPGSMQPT